MTMKFKGKALFSPRESVAETARVDMFLTTPYALDSPPAIDAENY